MVIVVAVGFLYWYSVTDGGNKPGGCLYDSEYNMSSDHQVLKPLLLLNRIKPSSIKFSRYDSKGWATQIGYSFSF